MARRFVTDWSQEYFQAWRTLIDRRPEVAQRVGVFAIASPGSRLLFGSENRRSPFAHDRIHTLVRQRSSGDGEAYGFSPRDPRLPVLGQTTVRAGRVGVLVLSDPDPRFSLARFRPDIEQILAHHREHAKEAPVDAVLQPPTPAVAALGAGAVLSAITTPAASELAGSLAS